MDRNDPALVMGVRALELLAKRDAQGNLAKNAEGEATLMDKHKARALLGIIDTVTQGQGGFTLLVPVSGVFHAGVATIWKQKGFPQITKDGRIFYHVADQMLTYALLERLELAAGTTLAEAQATYKATRPDVVRGGISR